MFRLSSDEVRSASTCSKLAAAVHLTSRPANNHRRIHNGFRLEDRRSHLQPLPHDRLARRPPLSQGGAETCRFAPWRVGPQVRQVGEWQAGRRQEPEQRQPGRHRGRR